MEEKHVLTPRKQNFTISIMNDAKLPNCLERLGSFEADIHLPPAMLLPSAWQTLILNGHTILAFSPDLVLQNSKWRMSPVSGRLNTFNILGTFSIIFPPLYPPESGNTPRPWSKMGPQLLDQYGTQHLLYLSLGYCTAKKNDIYKWNLWECWSFSKISIIIRQN